MHPAWAGDLFHPRYKEAPRGEADTLWDWKPDESTSLSSSGSRIKKLLNLRELTVSGQISMVQTLL